MSPWLESFWGGMYAHLWQTTLVVAVLWGLALLLRDAPARFHSRLWWAGLLKLFLPLPLIAPLARGAGEAVSGWLGAGDGWRVATSWAVVLGPPGLDAGSSAAVAAGPARLVWFGLTAAWVAGLLAVLWLRGRLRGRRIEAPAPLWACEEPLRSKVLAALAGTGVGEADVLLTASPVMPCVVGLWRSRLLLPRRAVAALPADELRAVIVHEQEHRRRLDPLRSGLETAALALFFFYPPAWLVVRRLAQSAEFDCDEAVLRAGLGTGTFARALARVIAANLEPSPRLALGVHGPSGLQRRIERLRSAEGHVASARHRVAVAAALATVLLFTLAPGDWLRAGEPEPQLVSGDWVQAGREPQREQVRIEIAHPELDALAGIGRRIDVEYLDTPLKEVIRDLARRTGLNIVADPDVRLDRTVTLTASNTTVKTVLTLLFRQANLTYEVVAPNMLLLRAIMRVGGEIQQPELIHRVAPVYPELARQARLEGVVILEAAIDTEGSVRDVKVLRGLGLGLDEAAVEAVRQWRYTPTLHNGEPVEVLLTVTVQFQLIQ